MHELISKWRKCKLDSPPYLFPGDANFIDKSSSHVYRSFNKYVASKYFGVPADTLLHTGLLPLRYVGNLAKASIYVRWNGQEYTSPSSAAKAIATDWKQANGWRFGSTRTLKAMSGNKLVI